MENFNQNVIVELYLIETIESNLYELRSVNRKWIYIVKLKTFIILNRYDTYSISINQ